MEPEYVVTHQQNNGPYNIEKNDDIEQCQEDDMILAKSMKKMLQEMPSSITPDCSIYRVSKRLVAINHVAYMPQVVSIGPLHHGREHLKAMEWHKLQGLDIYLRRINMNVEAAIEIARGWERRARSCYAEPTNYMNKNDFVKMMLVDGCFMIEFMLLAHHETHQTTENGLDPSFYVAIGSDLYNDFTMLENQLPLFVLESLFDRLSLESDGIKISFVEFIRKIFFDFPSVNSCMGVPKYVSEGKAKHLVDFLISYCVPTDQMSKKGWKKNFLHPPTLTALHEAGVSILKATDKPLMDISFTDGVLKIPPFKIYDNFETYVRNMMAFEQFHLISRPGYVTNYIAFLDGLISTEKDASLLVKAEILTNNIGGSDGEIAKLFNNLCKEIILPDGDCYYCDMTNALHGYCKKRWPKWKATLRREYFKTPWTLISVVAATFIILLTLLQTLFSALSITNTK